MTRTEHLAWAKARAKELINRGDHIEAWKSFSSDLLSHPELANHSGLMIGMGLIIIGDIKDCRTMWDHIEGYN